MQASTFFTRCGVKETTLGIRNFPNPGGAVSELALFLEKKQPCLPCSVVLVSHARNLAMPEEGRSFLQKKERKNFCL